MEEKDMILPEEPLAEEIPLEQIPEEISPAEATAVEETVAEEIPMEEVVMENTSVEENPAEYVPAEEAPVEDAPVEDAPVEDAPVEDAPVEDAPVEEAPVLEAPIEETPVVEPSAETAPVAEAPEIQEHELLTTPDHGDQIHAAEEAMANHDMAHPSQPYTEVVSPEPEIQEAPVTEYPDQAFRAAGSDFDQVFNTQPQEEEVPAHDRPARKGRPKRKKGEGLFGIPHMLATVVWLGIILAVGVTLGRMMWVCAAEVLAFGRPDKVVTVTIYESDTVEDVTAKLHKAGLIRYPGLFKLYAGLAVDEGEIDAGIWDLNTRYDYHALVNAMNASSSRAVIEDLLIPEGYTCKQIFALLEEKKVCTAKDLEEYAANGQLKDYWFLEGVERGSSNCLEGFLFPDTYDFYKNSSPKEVLEKMMDNFDNRFTEELQAQISTLNDHLAGLMRKNGRSDEFIADNQFTIRDVVIVASLIEKETANNAESYTIASVIYNRLFNWGGTPPFLNIDASIIYAQGGDSETIDTSLDSPYNTYLHTGLTPGPIANPGLASLKAALEPADTNYYFYVLNPATGKHQFSTTLEEHEGYVRQFASQGD